MQYKVLIAGLMASAVTAAPTPQEDIVGGTAAAAGEFPYIVSLQRSGSHFCGGSLVDSRTVVTAAHCTVGQTASSLTVRAGSLNRNSGGTLVRVSSVKVHPNYASGSAYNNDIAVWKLATAIPTSSTISYVSLPASGSDPAAGSTVTVAGWGTTSSGGSSPTALRRVDVPIVSRATCRNNYSASEVTDNMVCAGLTAGGKDSCQGDSGGPLVNASRQLVGIVSWGQGCAAPNYPGVYARVGTLVSFVTSNLG
ncbi:hypothetical protein OPT61_g1194 [Boeremia exigua]|uniref:Uncharacterized protein n=1 Tax=Boeremia exigua TaxID=749465 RepID=A0ACC2IR39_9PLEO|nr:hypothetical protein OPT61_g1194 [Boeremia exigua]